MIRLSVFLLKNLQLSRVSFLELGHLVGLLLDSVQVRLDRMESDLGRFCCSSDVE